MIHSAGGAQYVSCPKLISPDCGLTK